MDGRRKFGDGPAWTRAAVALIVTAFAPACVAGQRPGPTNTITDVAGIEIGHDSRTGDGWLSGTTVVLLREGATASVDVQGGAPGTRETDLLAPGGLVTEAHAIVLSGGSAYGLAAATGTMQWLEEQGIGYPIAGGVVPIVPSAILFDLGRGGDFTKRPDAEFGYRAAAAASDTPVEQGRVGAGTGARYGLGTASVVLPNGYTVGAIVGLNPAGSPVNPETCMPYGMFLELADEFGLVPPSADECAPADGGAAGPESGETFNTTIALVATDAPLDQTQAQRMAMVSNSGLARSIRPIHNLGDGDAVFAVATGGTDEVLGNPDLQALYNAAADALGRAVVHALLAEGGYCEQYPSACAGR
ncbi:MAG: P1 family peptidase [Longimicrobiales bacterium]